MAAGRARLRGIFNGMHTRCENPKRKDYNNYGGRGVSVCEEWSGKGGFANFYEWSVKNGYADGLTIDRIDGAFGYSPQNCRWATPSEQCRNRCTNHLLFYNGELKTIKEWSELMGIRKDTLRRRVVDRGWTIEAAMTTPVRKRNGVKRNRNG